MFFATNEHEYYLRTRMLFCCHFLASIREDSRSFVALFWQPFRPTAPGCLILQSRESRSVLDKLRVLFIIGGIVVIEIYRNFPQVSGTPKQPS